MAADSPAGSLRRSNNKLGTMRSPEDEANKGAKMNVSTKQHGGAFKALSLVAGLSLLCCAGVKLASPFLPHPGHAQLKALVVDGRWRHAEIDHLYKLGDEMQEAIGLVRSFPSSFRLFSLSSLARLVNFTRSLLLRARLLPLRLLRKTRAFLFLVSP